MTRANGKKHRRTLKHVGTVVPGPTVSFRNAASFGKRQEYIAVAELLRRKLDVYMTLVDDQQIDCIVRSVRNGRPRYLDIQIKARSLDCKPKDSARFAAMEIREPRRNFYFMFYSERADCYWIIPSKKLIVEATKAKSGKNIGRYSIVLTNWSERQQRAVPRPRFERFRDNFRALGCAE